MCSKSARIEKPINILLKFIELVGFHLLATSIRFDVDCWKYNLGCNYYPFYGYRYGYLRYFDMFFFSIYIYKYELRFESVVGFMVEMFCL